MRSRIVEVNGIGYYVGCSIELYGCNCDLERVEWVGIRFEETEPPGTRSFFTEIIASISDIKFARGGRYILSRDYMTLKVCTIYLY